MSTRGVYSLYDRIVSMVSLPPLLARPLRTRQPLQNDCSSPTSLSATIRIPPPHSHLHRHTSWSNYPLLCNSSATEQLRTGSSYHDKDRNVIAAMMSIVVIATLATALAQPKWFSINGGLCSRKYIGLQEFIYVNSFDDFEKDNQQVLTSKIFTSTDGDKLKKTLAWKLNPSQDLTLNSDLKNCVTPEVVTLQRTIIALCFLAIMANLIQFFMDTMGTSKKWANSLRQHAIGNIFGVLLCVIAIGVCYLVSNLLEKEQTRIVKQKPHATGQPLHVEVKFELSYYLVTLAGLLAILAAACNLLRRSIYYQVDFNDLLWSDEVVDVTNNRHIDEDASLSCPIINTTLWRPRPTSLSLTIPQPLPTVASSTSQVPPPPPYTP